MEALFNYNVTLPRERIRWIDYNAGYLAPSGTRIDDDFKLPFRITIDYVQFDRVFQVDHTEMQDGYMAAFSDITEWLIVNDMWLEYGETDSPTQVTTVLVYGGNEKSAREELRPKREWTLAFESENDAIAFKLRWF